MSKAIPTCDCVSLKAYKKGQLTSKSQVVMEKVEVEYSEQAEAHVCIYCRRYPTWVPADKAHEPEAWRKEFADDLRDLLATWNVWEENEDAENFVFGNGKRFEKEGA